MATADRERVYSHDRVRRLRVALWVALAVGVVLAALALWVLLAVLPDDADALPYAVTLAAAAAALLGVTTLALRLLPARARPAQRASVVTGVLLLPCSLLLGQVGFVTIVVGLSVLFLALIADDPDLGERR